ncbi:MAG TPA: hypothetical protein VE959_27920 [Bryobacteraceae bacterium]|nr:hypothetical protein [Bryobacteraceae bacterium]
MTTDEILKELQATNERLQRLQTTADEHAGRLDTQQLHIRGLATIAETTLDNIRALERIAQSHERQLDGLRAEIQALTREWQAYLRRLPSQ